MGVGSFFHVVVCSLLVLGACKADFHERMKQGIVSTQPKDIGISSNPPAGCTNTYYIPCPEFYENFAEFHNIDCKGKCHIYNTTSHGAIILTERTPQTGYLQLENLYLSAPLDPNECSFVTYVESLTGDPPAYYSPEQMSACETSQGNYKLPLNKFGQAGPFEIVLLIVCPDTCDVFYTNVYYPCIGVYDCEIPAPFRMLSR